MEFDIGNILYIVVTIIAIAASLLGKKKKPKGSGQEGARPGFMENLEQFLSQGQQEPSVMDLREDEPDLPEESFEMQEDTPLKARESKPVAEPAGMRSEYVAILERLRNNKGEIFNREGESMTEPLEVINLDEEEEGTDYFEIVKEFDAGTAVVYSAIINRVDY